MIRLRTKSGQAVHDLRFLKAGKDKRWFVVANRVDAVVSKEGNGRKFVFVKRFSNPEGHLTETELVSDKPGRGISSAGRGVIRHALDGRQPHAHHDRMAQKFAGEIAEYLSECEAQGRFTELVLVAEPRFLGFLRARLPQRLKKLVRDEVNREYTQASDQVIREKVLQALERGVGAP